MKFVTLLTILVGFTATFVTSNSCLTKNNTSYGISALGTSFTDFSYLETYEDSSFFYRLATVQLCKNSAGVLTGMRAVIVKVLYPSNVIGA